MICFHSKDAPLLFGELTYTISLMLCGEHKSDGKLTTYID